MRQTLSDREFALLGAKEFAYLKPVTIAGEAAIAIHAADGTPIKVLETIEEALKLLENNKIRHAKLH